MAEDELKLRLGLDRQPYVKGWADVRAQTNRELAQIKSNVASTLNQIAGQFAQMRATVASAGGKVRLGVDPQDAARVKQYTDSLNTLRQTLADLQTSVGKARNEIKGTDQETATSTRRFEVLDQTIQKLNERVGELQTSLSAEGATPQVARQVEALNAAAERVNGTFLNTQARLQDVAAGSDAVSVVVDEIRRLGEAVKDLETGKLQGLTSTLGNLGNAAQGIAALSRLNLTMEHVSRASASVRSGLQAATAGAQSFFTSVNQKSAQGVSAVSEGVSGLAAKLPSLASGLSAGGAGFAAIAAAGAVAVGALVVVGAAVAAVVAGFVALAVALPVAINLLQRIFDRGIDYNAQLEQTKLGIAAVVASLADLQTAQGKKLEGPEALNVALSLAQDQLQKLKVDAVNTTATFEQIAPAFQAAIGPGIRAGLTLDQIRETVVRITQAAGAIGLPFNQLNQEVRSILEGTINEDARLAKILGLSNEMVKSWREQGTLAAELNKRLEQFGAAGVKAAETLEGLQSNLQEALNVFTGEATQRAFNTLKERIARLLPQLFDFKAAGIDKSFRVLAEIIDDVFVRVINIAGDVTEQIVGAVKKIAGFLAENRGLVDAILQTSEDILRTLIQFARQLLTSVSNTRDWRSLLELTLGTLQVIKSVLQSFAPIIRDASMAASILLGVLVAANPLLRVLGAVSTAAPKSAAEVATATTQQATDALGVLEAALVRVKAKSVGGGGKGKGDNKAHQEAVRRLEQEEREIEEVYRWQTEALRREFDLQVTSSQSFTKDIIDAANKRFEGLQTVYRKQLAEAKKQSEIDKINNDILKAERERDKAVQEAQDAQDKREIESLRRHREALLDLQDEYDAQTIASIEARAEVEATTFEEAEEKAFKVQTDAFNRRLQAARDDEATFYAQQKDINDANEELAREHSDRVAAIVAQQERAQVEHHARVAAAQRKDLERQKKYQDELFGLQKTYEEQDRDAKRREIERALKSPIAQIRIQAISARVAMEVEEINRRERLTEQRLNGDEAAARRDFERRNKDLKGTKEYYDGLLLIEENYKALRKQNEDEAGQDRRDSVGRGDVEAERANPFSARSLFGDTHADALAQGMTQWQAFGVMASGILADLSAQAGNFGTIITSVFSSVGQAVGGVVKSFVLLGTAGISARKWAAEVIAAVAQMSAVKAVFELAEGLAALARAIFGDPKAGAEAALHFKSAAVYGGVAAVAAVAGRMMAGNAFKTGAAGEMADGGSGGGGGGSTGGGANGYEDYRSRYLREQAEKDQHTTRQDRRGASATTINLLVDGKVLATTTLNHVRDGGDVRDGFRRALE